MIKVTIYNEYVQEQQDEKVFPFTRSASPERLKEFANNARVIKSIHGGIGIHDTLQTLLEEDDEIEVINIAFLENVEETLSEEKLSKTDVLVWWAHVAHNELSDEVAYRVVKHVQQGMGIIFLHSAHLSKPMKYLLGTTGNLRWREGDFCRVWNTCPTHPIMQGISEYIELEEEEMYGEFFDVPTPESQCTMSWYSGGEVFRSGCTWTRGYGRIFYFQPGHETNKSYFVPEVRIIIRNAAHWCYQPEMRKNQLSCIHVEKSPEESRKK